MVNVFPVNSQNKMLCVVLSGLFISQGKMSVKVKRENSFSSCKCVFSKIYEREVKARACIRQGQEVLNRDRHKLYCVRAWDHGYRKVWQPYVSTDNRLAQTLAGVTEKDSTHVHVTAKERRLNEDSTPTQSR